MNHLIDTDDEKVADPELRRREQATQLKFLETLIDKLIKGRKHPTGAPPSSGMTNSFRVNPLSKYIF